MKFILSLVALLAFTVSTFAQGKLGPYLYAHPTTPIGASTNAIDPELGAYVIDTSTGLWYNKIAARGSNAAGTYALVTPDRVIATPVAAAGSTVADAGQLGSANVVTISSDGATKGVKLPTGQAGQIVTVINTTATACELYAASGGTVNGLSADASIVVPASKGVLCVCTASNTWTVYDLPAKATAS